jgi:hypothetical protein
MAVGTDEGMLGIYGGQFPHITSMVSPKRHFDLHSHRSHDHATTSQKSVNVQYLCFRQSEGLLVVVDSDNVLYGINLMNGRIDYQTQVSSTLSVTALHAPCGCRWMYIGTEHGDVLIFDGERGQASSGIIPCLLNVAMEDEPGTINFLLSLSNNLYYSAPITY